MLNEDTIASTFASMFSMMADMLRIHYELLESVSKIEGLPESEWQSMIRALEQTRQIRTRLQAFSDDLQR